MEVEVLVLEVLGEPCFEDENELLRLPGAEPLRLVGTEPLRLSGAELLRLVGVEPVRLSGAELLRFEPVELGFEVELLRFVVMTIQFEGSLGFVANHLG